MNNNIVSMQEIYKMFVSECNKKVPVVTGQSVCSITILKVFDTFNECAASYCMPFRCHLVF
jgi:hypothetical protein